MKLPISMCSSFGADFDGDEMTLFPVKGLAAVQECKAALWNNSDDSPYKEEDYDEIVPSKAPVIVSRSNTVALATTTCWSYRTRGHRLLRCILGG